MIIHIHLHYTFYYTPFLKQYYKIFFNDNI